MKIKKVKDGIIIETDKIVVLGSGPAITKIHKNRFIEFLRGLIKPMSITIGKPTKKKKN